MIQRIQTVYLLIVAIFMVLMMSFSVGHFYTETSVSDMTNLAVIAPDGTMNYAPWALFAILMVVAILSLVTIFLYRKRMLQIRLTLFSSIILVGYYVTLAAFVGNTERMWQFYSIMDFMSASDFNHPELVGYSCYRKG